MNPSLTAADHAALYSAHGWQPLAIRPNDKRPLLTGWQTANLEHTLQAIEANPDANVGIAVPRGYVVLDVDTKGNGPATVANLEHLHGRLPDTLAASTPTGGHHLWFTLPPGGGVGNRVAVAPGLDVRAAGGFVVAAPSVINGKPYAWTNWDCMAAPTIADAPAWLLNLLRQPTSKESPKVPMGEPLRIPEGMRNRTLFEAASAMRARGFPDGAIAAALGLMNLESCNPPLNADEVATIAASACRYVPEAQPWEVFSKREELPLGALLTIPVSGPSDLLASLEQNLCPLEVRENPFAPLPHYVDKWIPQDEVTLLAGHGGSGKSYVALSIAVHVALGLPFGQLATTQTKVVFFSAEDGRVVLGKRLAKVCRALKIDPAHLKGELHLLDASDIDPALYRSKNITPLADALAALVEKLGAGLVVVDNASDAFDGDEIKRADVRSFIRLLRSRIARPGRAVLLLAHINKASASGGKSVGAEDYSGSTAWHNSVRSRLSLAPDGNTLKIEHLKANLGVKADPVRLEWQDGAPLVVGVSVGAEVVATAKARDEADKAALVTLIQDCDERGERVTTSDRGPATTFKTLKTMVGFPRDTTSDRLTQLLRGLESEGRIYRRWIKTPDSKRREVFTCAMEIPPNAMFETPSADGEQIGGRQLGPQKVSLSPPTPPGGVSAFGGIPSPIPPNN